MPHLTCIFLLLTEKRERKETEKPLIKSWVYPFFSRWKLTGASCNAHRFESKPRSFAFQRKNPQKTWPRLTYNRSTRSLTPLLEIFPLCSFRRAQPKKWNQERSSRPSFSVVVLQSAYNSPAPRVGRFGQKAISDQLILSVAKTVKPSIGELRPTCRIRQTSILLIIQSMV